MLISVVALFYPGFQLGIDFKGGSILEMSYTNERPAQSDLDKSLATLPLGNYTLQPSGENAFTLRSKELSTEEKETVVEAMKLGNTVEAKEERFNAIGPIIGNELKTKAAMAFSVVILGIVLFVTYAFRKVSEPVSSWKYGLATIIALLHDVLIPTGMYIILSRFTGGEIDLLFVTGILAILGYSVHDTIVVFDRVRENLRVNKEMRLKKDFETTVGESVYQTIGRSINTSLTTLIVLLSLYIFGPETIRNFSLLLVIGIIVGTYSSVFVASPLLVTFEKMQSKAK
jgi:preprotein translocase subunit SecF